MKIVINFLLRKSRKADDGKTSICVRITYQGDRIELATGIYSSTNHWDASRQRIKDKAIGARVDNERLNQIKTEIQDTFNQLRSTNEDFDVNTIKRKLDIPIKQILFRQSKLSPLKLLVKKDKKA